MIDLLSLRRVMTGDHLKDGYNHFSNKEIKLKEKLEYDGTMTTYVEGLTCATITSESEIIELL